MEMKKMLFGIVSTADAVNFGDAGDEGVPNEELVPFEVWKKTP
jgi:hypothetical protein